MSQEAFIERIAAALLAGRRKPTARRNHIFGDAYESVLARRYAQDVARKLPGLFRTDTIQVAAIG
jgi:hypothetical protein